jgi:hypothetical protein
MIHYSKYYLQHNIIMLSQLPYMGNISIINILLKIHTIHKYLGIKQLILIIELIKTDASDIKKKHHPYTDGQRI